MKNVFNRQFEMIGRVLAFGQKYQAFFPPETVAGKLFATIGAIAPELNINAGSQAASLARSREATKVKKNTRRTLLDQMDTISTTARAIARDDTAAGLTFVTPRSASGRNLIDAARGFVTNAEAIKDQFIAHEVKPAFIKDLKTAISSFEAAIVSYNQAKGARTNATASVEEIIGKALDAVYRLDGIVPNKLADNYGALKEWESARKIVRARVTKAPPKAGPDPVPPAGVVTSPAATSPAAAAHS